jgi:hypothetical protein
MTSDPSTWFDHHYWGPDGPQPAKKWGGACGRGAAYKDMGTVTDGQAGAVRKISTGRKQHRGMASDSVKAR